LKGKKESGTQQRAHRRLATTLSLSFLSPLPTQGDFMNNLRSILFTLTVLLMATAAQAQQTKVQANVPFDFVVGDRAYTAGAYILKSTSDSGVPIRIDNTQEAETGIVLSNTCESLAPSATTKLVFHRLGDHYFLYQIWTAGRASGRQFPMSRIEVQLAQNHENPELVIVAANITR
jgi:hypothetical protein